MSRIAREDFSVYLAPQDYRDHRELAESINTMTKALGTLETLRQDFAANVSHGIQFPLTSIGGYAALLDNDALAPGRNKEQRWNSI